MDFRDLKLFLHLAQSQHFGRTAKAMFVSPSTLSRQIQRLEDELGSPLFIRDNRSVALTTTGQQFQQFAQSTLQAYQHFLQTLKLNEGILSGELHLFCSVTAAYSHLPAIIDKFKASYPFVELKLTTGDAANALDKVQSGEADLAIAGHPGSLPNGIEFCKIGEVPLVLIAPAQSEIHAVDVKNATVNWEHVPFILPEHGPTRKRIDHWFKLNGIHAPLIYATVAGHEAIVSMVALECGVALIPEVVLNNSAEIVRQRVKILDTVFMDTPFELGVCAQKKRLLEPLISAFWGILQ